MVIFDRYDFVVCCVRDRIVCDVWFEVKLLGREGEVVVQ